MGESDRWEGKVLVVAYAFPPFSPVGHSIRVVKFVKYLPGLGWLPTVLTVDDRKEYITLRKVGSASLLSEVPTGVVIHRTTAGEPSLESPENEKDLSKRRRAAGALIKFLGRARNWTIRTFFLPDLRIAWFPYAWSAGRRIIKGEGIDVIFATCPPHAAVLIGASLKRCTGKPLVLDYRDDWIDTPWHDAKPAPVRWIERRMERWAVRTADRVILVTDRSLNAFLARYPYEPRSKFVLIPNGCDLEEFARLDQASPTRPRTGFTIFHAGSLNVSESWGRTPAGFFDAVRGLLRDHPELARELTLVFAGDQPKAFQRLGEEIGLACPIQWLGHIPHDEVLSLARSADLLLAINYDGWSTLIPAKIYEYWAIGGPPILLLSCPGAATDFVKLHRLGFAVDPSDAPGIGDAILAAYRQRESFAPIRVPKDGIDAYDRRALSGKLAGVLSAAAAPKST